MFPYSYLQLPENCLLEKRIYKKLFYENTRMNATDKKWFTADIESITWMYTMKPELTVIKAFEEEHFSYEEVTVVELEISSSSHLKRLSDIIHRSIPYPLLLIFRENETLFFSIADKRYNLADGQAATLMALWVTDGFTQAGLTTAQEFFLQQLAYSKQPKIHLKSFYHNWIEAFRAYEVAAITGTFSMETETAKREARIEQLAAYRDTEQQLQELKSELKKQASFSEKVNLNVQIKSLENELKTIAKNL
jgi:hypothetical protein